jgi:hypothetical protein
MSTQFVVAAQTLTALYFGSASRYYVSDIINSNYINDFPGRCQNTEAFLGSAAW